LMRRVRRAIEENAFADFRARFVAGYQRHNEPNPT
jgi:queuine/archaeosine tRNA-ribosyltransferase